MKIKKPSKRQPLKLKYTINKKAKAHHKRLKKEAKKDAAANLNKAKRKPKVHIPNLWPEKAQLLQKMEDEQRRKKKNRSDDTTMQVDMEQDPGQSLEAYAAVARKATEDYELKLEPENESMVDTESTEYAATTQKFMRDLYKVIEQADVLIEVLDARDPEGFRHTKIEEHIIANGKKLILLLNKADLVDKSIAEQWMLHFRETLPCVIFKAAFSKSIKHSQNFQRASESDLKAGSLVFGAQSLLQLLKNYSRTETGAKKAIVVGVIGFPNVGKSSVINSLCRTSNAARVGAQPGITRSLQEISLDQKLKLIDTPGVICPTSSDPNEQVLLVLRNVVPISKVTNVMECIEYIVQKIPIAELMRTYNIPLFDGATGLLEHVARARGRLLKKNQVDWEGAAKLVLNDWVTGKIKFQVEPPLPQTTTSGPSRDINVVTELAEPLNLNIKVEKQSVPG